MLTQEPEKLKGFSGFLRLGIALRGTLLGEWEGFGEACCKPLVLRGLQLQII